MSIFFFKCQGQNIKYRTNKKILSQGIFMCIFKAPALNIQMY